MNENGARAVEVDRLVFRRTPNLVRSARVVTGPTLVRRPSAFLSSVCVLGHGTIERRRADLRHTTRATAPGDRRPAPLGSESLLLAAIARRRRTARGLALRDTHAAQRQQIAHELRAAARRTKPACAHPIEHGHPEPAPPSPTCIGAEDASASSAPALERRAARPTTCQSRRPGTRRRPTERAALARRDRQGRFRAVRPSPAASRSIQQRVGPTIGRPGAPPRQAAVRPERTGTPARAPSAADRAARSPPRASETAVNCARLRASSAISFLRNSTGQSRAVDLPKVELQAIEPQQFVRTPRPIEHSSSSGTARSQNGRASSRCTAGPSALSPIASSTICR